MSFQVGDEVEWRSQSAGTWKSKRGVVIEIIPQGDRPKIKGSGWGRHGESYVVRVGGRKYWPYANKLTAVSR